MGNWSSNPTYRSYNPIYNWKGAHLEHIWRIIFRKLLGWMGPHLEHVVRGPGVNLGAFYKP